LKIRQFGAPILTQGFCDFRETIGIQRHSN
jgi:hypothetical protein